MKVMVRKRIVLILFAICFAGAAQAQTTQLPPGGAIRIQVFSFTAGNLSDGFFNGRFVGLDPGDASVERGDWRKPYRNELGQFGRTSYVWLKRGQIKATRLKFSTSVASILHAFRFRLRDNTYSIMTVPLEIDLSQRRLGCLGSSCDSGSILPEVPWFVPFRLAIVPLTLGKILYGSPIDLQLVDPVSGASAVVRVTYLP